MSLTRRAGHRRTSRAEFGMEGFQARRSAPRQGKACEPRDACTPDRARPWRPGAVTPDDRIVPYSRRRWSRRLVLAVTGFAQLEHRHYGQIAQEQQEQDEKQPDRPEQKHEIPAGRIKHAPA